MLYGSLEINTLTGVTDYDRYQCSYSRNINISVTKPEDYTIDLGDSIDFHSTISSLYENNVATLWKGTFQYKKTGSDEWIDVDANFMDADRTETGQVYSLTPDASFDQAQVRYKYVLSRDTSVVVYSNAGTININPYLPVAADDTVTTVLNTPATISVLTNDSDPNGDMLTVTSTTTPTHGSVVINSDGTVVYTPAGGYAGTDTFDYTISDGNGGTATATVIVTVTNAPPTVMPTQTDGLSSMTKTGEGTATVIPVIVIALMGGALSYWHIFTKKERGRRVSGSLGDTGAV